MCVCVPGERIYNREEQYRLSRITQGVVQNVPDDTTVLLNGLFYDWAVKGMSCFFVLVFVLFVSPYVLF